MTAGTVPAGVGNPNRMSWHIVTAISLNNAVRMMFTVTQSLGNINVSQQLCTNRLTFALNIEHIMPGARSVKPAVSDAGAGKVRRAEKGVFLQLLGRSLALQARAVLPALLANQPHAVSVLQDSGDSDNPPLAMGL